MQDDEYSPQKKMQPPTKDHASNSRVLIQYDNAFRKPQFSRESVFEDNVSSFKEESTPNLLSTAASSLSNLTIDDDDYNFENLLKASQQKVINSNAVTNDYNSTGQLCESLKNMKVTSSNDSRNDQQNSFFKRQTDDDKYYATHDGRRIPQENNSTRNDEESNYRREQRTVCNQNSEQYPFINRTTIDLRKPDTQPLRTIPQNLKTDKSSNIYNEKERRADNSHRPEVNDNKKSLQNFFNSNEGVIPYEENSQNIAYEELLLDQCIRKGKAKVTKRNINDIKPFSWDVNQICLTTKVMSKNYIEEIKREKKDDGRKNFGLQKQNKRH